MKISSEKAPERGSILLEFLGFGLLLQVLALTFFVQIVNLQTHQIAAESIARHGMRFFVSSNVDPNETSLQILDDLGVMSKPDIRMECKPNCFERGSKIVLRVNLNSASAESVWIR